MASKRFHVKIAKTPDICNRFGDFLEILGLSADKFAKFQGKSLRFGENWLSSSWKLTKIAKTLDICNRFGDFLGILGLSADKFAKSQGNWFRFGENQLSDSRKLAKIAKYPRHVQLFWRFSGSPSTVKPQNRQNPRTFATVLAILSTNPDDFVV